MANADDSVFSDNDEEVSTVVTGARDTKHTESSSENIGNKREEKKDDVSTRETKKTKTPSSVDAHPNGSGPAVVQNIGGDLNVITNVTKGGTASTFSKLWIVPAMAIIACMFISVQNYQKVNDLSQSLFSLQLKIEDLQYANTKIREDNRILSSQVNAEEKLNNQLRNDLGIVKRKLEELAMAQRRLLKPQEVLQSGSTQSLDTPADDIEEKNSIWNYFSSSSLGGDILSSVDGDMFGRFLNSMKQRKTEFKSQTDDTWIQLEASAMKTMSEIEPSRPSAVLILSPPSLDPKFGPCFAKKIAFAVNDAFQMGSRHPKVLDSQYLHEIGSVSNIHKDLNAYLKSKGKAVVVSNLAEIQDDPVLMVLHAFCENSNTLAPDSRANFFSTVTVPQSVYDMWRDKWTDYWQGKHIATDTLDLVWQTALTGDKRAALISRVASAVVLLQDGDTCV